MRRHVVTRTTKKFGPTLLRTTEYEVISCPVSKYSAPALLEMPQAQLDEIFENSSSGELPDGRIRGTFFGCGGYRVERGMSEMIRTMVWQGKVFDAEHRRVKNLLSPFGLESVSARVYKAESRFDGNECIVLDYSGNFLRTIGVRDELREIAADVYLGKVYVAGMHMPDFILEREIR
jgi:hypothetical protein